MAVTATVSVEGILPNGTVNSAMPRILPGGTATPGDRLIQWEAELWVEGITTALTGSSGMLFKPWDHQYGLQPGLLYTARVRVQSQDWSWSPWVSTNFRPDYAVPAPPTVSVIPTTHPTSGAPGMQLVVTPHVSLKDTANVRVDVQRADNSYEWLMVGSVFKRPGYVAADFDDWTCPSVGDNMWRARVVTRNQFGADVVGGWTYTAQYAMPHENLSGWLVPQGHPHMARKLWVTSWSPNNHEIPTQVTNPISPLPRTVPGYLSHADRPQTSRITTGLRRRPKSSLQARAHTEEECDALLELLSCGEKLLLRGHNELGLNSERKRRRDIWLRVGEEVVEEHYQQHAHQFRHITFTYYVQPPWSIND